MCVTNAAIDHRDDMDKADEERMDSDGEESGVNHLAAGEGYEGTKAGRWTDEEHAKFLEALELYGKYWNKVHKHVGTRTSAQTRSHAQKYFNKLTKKTSKDEAKIHGSNKEVSSNRSGSSHRKSQGNDEIM